MIPEGILDGKNPVTQRERFAKLPGLTEVQEKYFMTIRTGTLVSVLGAWIQSERRESQQELVVMIRSQLAMLAS